MTNSLSRPQWVNLHMLFHFRFVWQPARLRCEEEEHPQTCPSSQVLQLGQTARCKWIERARKGHITSGKWHGAVSILWAKFISGIVKICFVFSQHWCGTGSGHASLWKAGSHLYYIVSAMWLGSPGHQQPGYWLSYPGIFHFQNPKD